MDADRTLTEEGEERMKKALAESFPELPQYNMHFHRLSELEDWFGQDVRLGHIDMLNYEWLKHYCVKYKSLDIPKKEADEAIIKTNIKVFGESTPISTGLRIEEYSEKAIVVLGDTKPVAETLKSLGGKFNARLKCGAGWIFSKKAEARIKEAFGI